NKTVIHLLKTFYLCWIWFCCRTIIEINHVCYSLCFDDCERIRLSKVIRQPFISSWTKKYFVHRTIRGVTISGLESVFIEEENHMGRSDAYRNLTYTSSILEMNE